MKLSQAIAYVAAQNAPIQRRLTRAGFPVAIEHPRGTMRIIKDDDGNVVWKKYMFHSYGYIEDTMGKDGDEVDVMLGPIADPDDVYVIHMKDMNPDVSQRQDEDKVMLGWDSAEAAKQAFFTHYPRNFFGGMTVVPVDEYKEQLATATA